MVIKPVMFKQHTFGWLVGISIVGLMAWGAWASIQRPAFRMSKMFSLPAALPSSLFEGSISEIVGSHSSPASLAIAGRDGSLLRLAVDPQETVVLQGGKVTEASHLEKGQRVRTRYVLKDGKEVARTIEITDPLPAPAPSDKPVPAGTEKPMSEF